MLLLTEVGVGHLGPPLLGPNNSGFNKPGIISGPRSEPVLRLIDSPGAVHEKAHSEGSSVSPEDIMEEDPMMSNSEKSKARKEKASEQGIETLNASQNIEHGKAIERVNELTVKERLVTDSNQNLGARKYKKKLGGASRRDVGKGHITNKGWAQNKRKFEKGLVEVEIKDVSTQSPNKKQKVDDQGGVSCVAEKVEVASQKWAHSTR